MDIQLFYLINRGMANPFFDLLMPALTQQGYLLVLPLAVYALIAGSRARTPAGRSFVTTALAAVVIAAVAVPLADALGDWLKVIFARPRPCRALEDVRLLVRCPSSFSMPSGHAITSFAGALPLFLLTRPFLATGWRIAPLVLAALIAFSRPYLGVHYPSDMLAGSLIGAAVSGGMCWGFGMMQRLLNRDGRGHVDAKEN